MRVSSPLHFLLEPSYVALLYRLLLLILKQGQISLKNVSLKYVLIPLILRYEVSHSMIFRNISL